MNNGFFNPWDWQYYVQWLRLLCMKMPWFKYYFESYIFLTLFSIACFNVTVFKPLFSYHAFYIIFFIPYFPYRVFYNRFFTPCLSHHNFVWYIFNIRFSMILQLHALNISFTDPTFSIATISEIVCTFFIQLATSACNDRVAVCSR